MSKDVADALVDLRFADPHTLVEVVHVVDGGREDAPEFVVYSLRREQLRPRVPLGDIEVSVMNLTLVHFGRFRPNQAPPPPSASLVTRRRV